MLDNCSGSIRQEIPACLRSGRFRDGAGVPRPLPLRWAYAGQTAGGQNHLPTENNTINSEPPTSTDQTQEAPREPPGFGAPDGALLRKTIDVDQENAGIKYEKRLYVAL